MTYKNKKLTSRLVIRAGLFVALALLVNCGSDLDLGDPATVLLIRSEALPSKSLTYNQDCVAFTASGRAYTGWVAAGDSTLFYREGGRLIRILTHSDGARQKQESLFWNGKRAVVSLEWPLGQEESGSSQEAGEAECVNGIIRER